MFGANSTVANMDRAGAVPGDPANARVGYVKDAGLGGAFDGYMFSNVPLSMSSGQVHCRMRRTANTNSSWIFGLATNILPIMDLNAYVHAIYSLGDGNVNYKTPDGNGLIALEANNLRGINISYELEKIYFTYDGTTTAGLDFVHGKDYKLCFSAMELDTVGLEDDPAFRQIQVINSAFVTVDNNGNVVQNTDSLVYNPNHGYVDDDGNPKLTFTTAYRYISFVGSNFGNILGFQNVEYIQGSAGNSFFRAQYAYLNRVFPTSLIVYIPSLQLQSYSNTSQSRENILAILPDVNFQNDTYTYVYQAPQPIFIDINNISDLAIANLAVNIIPGDQLRNQPIAIPANGCTLSILIKED